MRHGEIVLPRFLMSLTYQVTLFGLSFIDMAGKPDSPAANAASPVPQDPYAFAMELLESDLEVNMMCPSMRCHDRPILICPSGGMQSPIQYYKTYHQRPTSAPGLAVKRSTQSSSGPSTLAAQVKAIRSCITCKPETHLANAFSGTGATRLNHPGKEGQVEIGPRKAHVLCQLHFTCHPRQSYKGEGQWGCMLFTACLTWLLYPGT